MRVAALCAGCGLVAIALTSCGDVFRQGQMRDGVTTSFPPTFISTNDGRIYELEEQD